MQILILAWAGIFAMVALSVIVTSIKDLFSEEWGAADASAVGFFFGFLLMLGLGGLMAVHPSWAALHVIACVALSAVLISIWKRAERTQQTCQLLCFAFAFMVFVIGCDLAVLLEQERLVKALNEIVLLLYLPLVFAGLPFIGYRALRRLILSVQLK